MKNSNGTVPARLPLPAGAETSPSPGTHVWAVVIDEATVLTVTSSLVSVQQRCGSRRWCSASSRCRRDPVVVTWHVGRTAVPDVVVAVAGDRDGG